jgi:hypothetical protein
MPMQGARRETAVDGLALTGRVFPPERVGA